MIVFVDKKHSLLIQVRQRYKPPKIRSNETLDKYQKKENMTEEKSKDPLQGVTLERILTDLHEHYGWETLAEKIHIRCFQENPSLMSSLKFLRRTPWARTKVERLYLKLIKRQETGAVRKQDG